MGFPKTKIVTFSHLGKTKIPPTATLSSKVKVSYKSSGVKGAGETRIPSVLGLVGTEEEKLRSGELKTPELLPRRPPAALLARRGCLLSPVGVSLCCAGCEAGVVVGVPSGVWGSGTRSRAARGGRWGVRSRENVNFIPSCGCGTSAEQGRGAALPAGPPRPRARLLCAGRPARPPARPPFLPQAPGARVAANSFAS